MTGPARGRCRARAVPRLGRPPPQPVLLEYGRQKMHLNILNGGFNLNWMELSPASTGFIPNGTYKFLNGANGSGVDGSHEHQSRRGQQLRPARPISNGTSSTLAAANTKSRRCPTVTVGISIMTTLLITTSGWGTGGNQCFILAPTSGGYYSILPVGNGVSLETSDRQSGHR